MTKILQTFMAMFFWSLLIQTVFADKCTTVKINPRNTKSFENKIKLNEKMEMTKISCVCYLKMLNDDGKKCKIPYKIE